MEGGMPADKYDLRYPQRALELALQDALMVEFRRLGAGSRFSATVSFPIAMISIANGDDVTYFRGSAHQLLRKALASSDLADFARRGDYGTFGPFHGSKAIKRNLRAAAGSLGMALFESQMNEFTRGHFNPHVLLAVAACKAALAHRAQLNWERGQVGIRPLKASLSAALETYRSTLRHLPKDILGPIRIEKTVSLCEQQIEHIAPVLGKCEAAIKSAKRARRLANKAQAEAARAVEFEASVFAP
jgi:hypothetical protein